MPLITRRAMLGALAAAPLMPLPAQAASLSPEAVVARWYALILELVRHTPTYSPPVASRAFAYVGIAAFEAQAGGSGRLVTLAGQLNGLTSLPPRAAGQTFDAAVVLHACLAVAVPAFFANTGPTGQRAMQAMARTLGDRVAQGLPSDVIDRSTAQGQAVAAHILDWSADDGGAVITNMGFPLDHAPTEGPEHWVPTSLVAQQQKPLLPAWGRNRTFAMPDGAACGLPPPPDYSEEPGSAFYAEAMEVLETKQNLTPEQRAIARFWSDDPMLSPTPPGHWISIALQVLDAEGADIDLRVETLARLGITLADAFVACWHTKFQHDLLRPVTYIRRLIDPKWESLLNTPPFPEYPSGHSTQSGAAAVVLTDLFGPDFAFDDATHIDDGLPARRFASFWAAAEEAGISRLYGGIHFRSAVVQGLEQGRCVGGHAVALRTRV